MLNFFGSLFRGLSAVIVLLAIRNFLAAFSGRAPSQNLLIGAIGLILATIAYFIGTWLKNRPKLTPLVQQVRNVESAWWNADQGLRLAFFCSAVWVVGTFFWQESYDRELGIVLWPAISIIAIYFSYRKLVVAPKKSTSPIASLKASSLPPKISEDSKLQLAEPDPSVNLSTPRDRDRAMDELIRRMHSK